MRTRILFRASVLVLLISLFLATSARGQELVCSMTTGGSQGVEQIIIGGRYRTSTGVLRVLVVFVRFKGDNETTSAWPDTNALPYWAANFVDSSVSTIGSTDAKNLSTYFYENSYGKLKLIGDVYYVTTDNNESYYHNYSTNDDAVRGHLNREILLKLDGAPYNLNFARYDKWGDPSEYNHTYSENGDGKIDMIWMITRNYHDVSTRFGRAAADFQLEGGSLTLDGVTIYHTADNMDMTSSGITLFGPNMYTPRYIYDPSAPTGVPTLVGTMAHEMTHYFFGLNHLGEGTIATRRGNGNFSGYSGNAGNCFGHYLGYEKYRLGWLTPKPYTSNIDNVMLYDLATTTDTTKDRLLKIPISGTNQYFLIENRRWISNFETRYSPYNLSHAVLSSGIIIYHIIYENSELSSTEGQIRCADGRFVWKFIQGGETQTKSDDVIDKDSADFVNGYDERESIYFPNKGPGEIWLAEYAGNDRWYPNATNYRDAMTDASDYTGDRFDVFDVGYVVNPWSNPGSHSWNEQSSTWSQTTIGVEVTGFNSTTQAHTLSIRVSSPEDLSPSKPQNLKGAYAGNGLVNLTWRPNGEPDISQYRIYRDGPLVQTVAHPPASDPVTPNAQTVVYAIKARDTQGKESVLSDAISVLLPPAAPVLVSPSNGSTGASTSLTLSWNSSSGATSYGVQVSTDTSFSTAIVNQTGITTTSYAVSGLANNTTYYWHVNATGVGGTSNWSSRWSFTTEPLPQYYLTVNSPCGLPTSGSGLYNAGQTATACVTSTTVSGGTGIRYVFTNWSGDVGGTSSCVNLTMDGPKSVTANCKTQYYLTVISYLGTTTGQGWYDAGSTAYAGLTSNPVSGGTGMRYGFTSWWGDASGSNYAQSNPIIMNGPKTAIAGWQAENYLSVSWNAGGYVSGTASGWYNENTVVGGWSATANSGYYFVSWQDGYTQTYRPALQIYLPITLYASFAQVQLNPPSGLYTIFNGCAVLNWTAPSPPPLYYNIYRHNTCGGSWEQVASGVTSTSWQHCPTWEGCEWYEYGVTAVYSGGESSMTIALLWFV